MPRPLDELLSSLNENQRTAVTAPLNSRICVIAGPGTGKTKVLVSRVAHLLLHDQIPPQQIIVTTFTKKAANEMVLRLRLVLQDTDIDVNRLMVGTFHSICYRIIKKYGHLIGLEGFTIADEKDSIHLLEECLEKIGKNPQQNDDEKQDTKRYRAKISSLKSRAITPIVFKKSHSDEYLLSLYETYQESLTAAKLLDFDDCLVRCHELLLQYPVLNFVKSVLVDEFQDTNEIQLQLMYEFAKGHPSDQNLQNNVLIVGDPDQSIYGFRDAQVGNFKKMVTFYENKGLSCTTILLEENYRSTAGILDFSESIMRQQKLRTIKNLRSQKNATYKPVIASLKGLEQEGRWIVYQIETLLSLPGQPLRHEDIAILFRAAYQTRAVEQELTRRGIPYLMLRGKAFWDRKEVVVFMDYLRVVSNESDRLALVRTLNYPKRGIGEKAMKLIENELQNSANLVHQTLVAFCKSGQLSSKTKEGLSAYLGLIERCREHLDHYEMTHDKSLLERLSSELLRDSGLQTEFEDDSNKMLNITEVQRQLLDFEPQDEQIELFIGGSENDQADDPFNHIQKFVQAIGLYESEESAQSKEKSTSRITLSTIHGSKGLEWHTVFVPGLSEGVLPAGFAIADNSEQSADEERRCFYVATTRAKTLLYISSYIEEEGKWGRKPIEAVSRFLTKIKPDMISEFQSAICSKKDLISLYQLMAREYDETFDIDQFASMYKLKLSEFVRGKSNIDLSNLSAGFVSARKTNAIASSVFETNRRPAPRSAISRVSKAPTKQKGFNPPRQITSSSSKAPSYVRTTAPTVPKATKMAPPYIPDRRRAPAYIPNRKAP